MGSDIKKRILTASILAIFIAMAIFLLPGLEFTIIMTLILAIAAWEWCRLIGLKNNFQQSLYILFLILVFIIGKNLFPQIILLLSIVFWLYTIVLLYQFSQKRTLLIGNKFMLIIAGFFLLIPCIVSFDVLRDVSPKYLLYGMFLVWATDTGAFVFGRYFGRHKLAPNISPGKTVEGLFGGLILALLIAIIGALLLHIPYQRWLALLVLTILVSFGAVLGDLFESMMKRWAGVKDSGNWLPGHGGLLDRIDSLLCALPVFALGLMLVNF